MRFNYVRAGQIVVDKVSLKDLTVVESVADRALLREMDDDGNPAGDTVVMTEKNAICFKLIDDPNPLDYPKGCFEATEGILYADGEPVTENQGEIYILDILGKIRGAVILSARTPGSDDLMDLLAYEPFHDRFNCLKRGLKGSLSFVTAFEDLGVVNNLFVERKAIKENDEEKEIEVVSSFSILAVSRRTIADTWQMPFEPDCDDIQKVKDKIFIGGMIIDCNSKCVHEEITGHTHGYLTLQNNMLGMVTAEKSIITRSLKYGFVFKNDNTVQYNTDISIQTDKLAATSDFPYLVDITSKNGITVFTFADAEHNTIRLIRKETWDRGYCYSVEE